MEPHKKIGSVSMKTEEELKTMWESEPLHPDLLPHVQPLPKLGWSGLRHPLVFAVPYLEQMNKMLNQQYLFKRQKLEKCRKEKNWTQYIWLYERPHRLEAFTEIEPLLSDRKYWELLGSVWSDSENLWQYGPMLRPLITNPHRRHRDFLMNEEEKSLHARLPPLVTVYRGHQQVNRNGFSWSLSHWTAEWFANRFSAKRHGVICGKVRKEDIIGVLLGRSEMEIIAEPEKVVEKKTFTVRLSKEYRGVLDHALLAFKLGSKSRHGPWHWTRVFSNATYLARRTPGTDLKVCRLFALLHDCQRTSEGDDPEHGERAGEFALKLYKEGVLDLSNEQAVTLAQACADHEKGTTSSDPTVGVCWDSDRLELTRVGIIPDPHLFSTETGRNAIFQV